MNYLSPEISFSALNNNDVATVSTGTKPTPGGNGTTIIPK